MGDREPPRAPPAAAPQDQVEVEDSRSPAAAAPASEVAFYDLEAPKQFGWIGVALDERDRIGKIAAGATMGCVEHDRRSIEQAELLVEPSDRRLDDAAWAAVPAMRAVGADGDCVKVASF